MKILHILYSGLGGHANVFFSMVKADAQKEYIHEALFAGVEDLREDYVKQCAINDIRYNFLKKRPGLDIRFYRKLVGHIRSAKPGIIFLHGSANVLPARLATLFSTGRKKIIVRETQANTLKTKKDWLSLRLALVFASHVVFLSDDYREEVSKKCNWLYRTRKTSVIPNGIDLALFAPLDKPWGKEIIIGMQSRIVAIKDHQSLLKAFAMIKDQQPDLEIKLRIAGDGDQRARLDEAVMQLHVDKQVEFTGTLDEASLVSFIRSLDIYIHASLGETMSTAIMQAMACKKAVIASDVPGINNMIINRETGLLVPVKDPGALANAIMLLINDRELAEALEANAYRFALDHYSNTVMFNRYTQLFNS